MKNFLSFFSPKNLREIVQTLWMRFPIPSILVLINTVFIGYQINSSTDSEIVLRVMLTLVVTFFLSTGVGIFAESQKQTPYSKWSPIIPLLYGIAFFFTIHSLDMNSGVFNEPFIYFSLHLVGFISWIFFAPYLLRRTQNEQESIQYTNYFTHIAWTLLMSAIVGAALAALGSIAIGAVGLLFEMDALINEWKMYENWIMLALSLSAPLYGLLHLPLLRDIGEKDYDTNKFFAFIVRFIVIPFVFLYFCILYAYSIKVLLNISDWPKGEISWLVIGFSIFGYLGYMFSKSYEAGNTIVQLFRKYFPYVVLPQIPMLGYAIALRINQYDLTINRYFVVIFGIWLTIISLYFVIGKIKSLTVIPATLTLITLVISIGPWGIYQLPLSRQYDRLLGNLEKAEILKNNKVLVASNTLDITLENDIYSGIEFVCRFEECRRIKTLFSDIVIEAQTRDEKNWNDNTYNEGVTYPGIHYWAVVLAVTNALGIEQRYVGENNETRKYISFNSKGNEPYESPIIVTGYNTIYAIRTYYPGENPPISGNYVFINIDKEELVLREDSIETRFSLQEINKALISKYNNTHNGDLEKDELSFTLTENNRSIKLIFQSYAYQNPDFTGEQETEYAHIAGYILVK